MRRLAPLEKLWHAFRGGVLGRPYTELEHALSTRAHFHESNDPARPLRASVRSEPWVVVVDPATKTLTLEIAGRAIGPVTEWPPEWTLPGDEPDVLDLVKRIAGI